MVDYLLTTNNDLMINNLMLKPVFNWVTICFRFRTKRGIYLFYNGAVFFFLIYFFCKYFFYVSTEEVHKKFHVALS